MKIYMRLNKSYYEIILVNLKWLEIYQLVIKSEKHLLALEILLIMKLIIMLLMNDIMQKMLFVMAILKKTNTP